MDLERSFGDSIMGVKIDGVQAIIEFVEQVAVSAQIGTAYETASRINGRIPVDTGYARNSTIVTPNRDDVGTLGNNDLEARIALVNQIKLGETVYINNGAEYIDILEKGHSQQAPSGFVQTTLPEVPAIADKQIKDAVRAGR